ncbi:MAG: hypothetical protein LCH54_01840 [Bacteroidetes bacterium]|nr:hypothetical protein [Bacteroidota bacterium]
MDKFRVVVPSCLILLVISFLIPRNAISQQTLFWGKEGVFWPIMNYESAFIGKQNNFIVQVPDYMAFGSIRYVISDSGNASYSFGAGLASLQAGIQKNLFFYRGLPVNIKLSCGIYTGVGFYGETKLNFGVFQYNKINITGSFTAGAHSESFIFKDEKYLQTDLFLNYKIKNSIEFGVGMGISKIFFAKKVSDLSNPEIFNTIHTHRMTWQLAGTITYFLGNK